MMFLARPSLPNAIMDQSSPLTILSLPSEEVWKEELPLC